MRLIDADKLKRKVQRIATEAWTMKLNASVETTLNQFIDYVDEAPTIDAVSVVRCKDCKHMYDGIKDDGYLICHKFNHFINADDYCSYGEREGE